MLKDFGIGLQAGYYIGERLYSLLVVG